jgi:hypothetical protein
VLIAQKLAKFGDNQYMTILFWLLNYQGQSALYSDRPLSFHFPQKSLRCRPANLSHRVLKVINSACAATGTKGPHLPHDITDDRQPMMFRKTQKSSENTLFSEDFEISITWKIVVKAHRSL